MPKPLVFISHSATDPLAREVLDELRAKLDPDFEVLLDKDRLEAGSGWRRELDIWMGLCHAAVILFSQEALESEWVLKEATILRWRLSLDANFVVIPVRIPPVNRKKLEENEKLSPLALNEIQMLTAEKASDVVDRIVKRLEPLKDQAEVNTGLRKLEAWLGSMLSQLETRNPQSMLDAATKMGLTLPWRSDSGYSKQLARALLSAEFSQITSAVLEMAPYFEPLTKGIEIINRLSPLWVDPHAAVRLTEMFKLPQQQRAVWVNGAKHNFTPKCYLSRANPEIIPWVIANLTPPNGLEEGDQQIAIMEQEVVTQVLPFINQENITVEDFFTGDADELVERLEKTEPLFIVVPKGIDDDLIEKLRKRFFRFTFFLVNDDQSLEQAKLKLKHIELLEPKLDPDVEKSNNALYNLTIGAVKRLKP